MISNRKTFFVAAGLGQVVALPAFAHAAEQGFVLLLPTTAYITAGTLVVVATMLLLFILKPGQLAKTFKPIETSFQGHWLLPPKLAPLIGTFSLGLLIFIGLVGPNDPQANLLPLTLWTVWWMALFVIQGVLFDVWRWINPWVALHRLIQPDGAGYFSVRTRHSVWGAVALFIAFQGFVLADVAPNDPDRLAIFALGYSAFTLLGMSLFGRDFWLRDVECFTVLFSLIGAMRIARIDDRLRFGMPGWQFFRAGKLGVSHAVFVLVILAAGSFDGLHETFWWLGQIGINPLEFPGRSAMVWKSSVGLYAAIFVLTVIFAVAVYLGVFAVRRSENQQTVLFIVALVRFSVTLLPIAIGYHFAHYLVTFLVQIQFVVANLADPLAKGWNLFGLGSTRVKVGFLAVPDTVKTIWITQAGVVVLCHVLSVLLSHRTAETLCKNKHNVMRLQLGLSVLMVAYTIFGLWLLASPRGV